MSAELNDSSLNWFSVPSDEFWSMSSVYSGISSQSWPLAGCHEREGGCQNWRRSFCEGVFEAGRSFRILSHGCQALSFEYWESSLALDCASD